MYGVGSVVYVMGVEIVYGVVSGFVLEMLVEISFSIYVWIGGIVVVVVLLMGVFWFFLWMWM